MLIKNIKLLSTILITLFIINTKLKNLIDYLKLINVAIKQ